VTEPRVELVVAAKEAVARDVVALTLACPDGAELPSWAPGAHLDLLLDNGLVRQYSLCGDPADRHHFRVAVLREPAGRGGSAHVHDVLAAGDRIAVQGPRNHFALAPAPRYLFVAGGIGITPILPMLTAAHAAGADWQLLYGGRSRASMAFRDALEAFGDRVRICPQDEVGLLDLPAALADAMPDTKIYCCGPEPLLLAVEQHHRLSPVLPSDALHVERFAPKQIDGPDVEVPFEVELALSGLTVKVPPGCTILQAVEQAGVAALSSCQEGTCGTCETGVLDGLPDHRDSILSDAERASGEVMMICVSRSCTPRLVLDL